MRQVAYCFACWPGGPVIPPPCLTCGSHQGYYAAGLCIRCHPWGDPGPDSCRDCLAWGARRTNKWLCIGCVHWRVKYSNPSSGGRVGPCTSCRRALVRGARGVCRLCHKQATYLREPSRPFDATAANEHGQQLFLADMFTRGKTATATGNIQQARKPLPLIPHCLTLRQEQLTLFTMKPDLVAHGRAGLHQRAHPDDAAGLEAIAHQVAESNKWSVRQRNDAIIGTKIMLGIQAGGQAPVHASEVEALRDIDLCVWTVIEVLAAAGALIEDRAPAIDSWLVERLDGLPESMVEELQTWFEVMKNGTKTPPRRRPRSHQTITLHLSWALPILRQWAAAGHGSLREISKEHVLDALPAAGAERARAGQGLKSIFRLLKARKVLFLDPTARLKTGEHPSNQPLPLDPDRISHIRELLFAEDPATALVVALIAFHGIRMGQLQRIALTDIIDGRLTVDGRVIPLADPVRERLGDWLDHRGSRWPDTTNGYLFINRRSVYRGCTVGARWLRLAIGPTLTPRELREDRILAEVHANGGDVRAIADLFGLSINASSRYAYTLEHDDLVASSRTHDTT
ncbi:MAG: hypothetical protein H0X00_22585 [Sporichthya sp.]|nr:hypothetical protein [Sporichthya sp.]